MSVNETMLKPIFVISTPTHVQCRRVACLILTTRGRPRPFCATPIGNILKNSVITYVYGLTNSVVNDIICILIYPNDRLIFSSLRKKY